MDIEDNRVSLSEIDFSVQIAKIEWDEFPEFEEVEWVDDFDFWDEMLAFSEDKTEAHQNAKLVGRFYDINDIKRQLKALRMLLSKTTLNVVHLREVIFLFILILFGLCENEPKYIFFPMMGISFFRIFSYLKLHLTVSIFSIFCQ